MKERCQAVVIRVAHDPSSGEMLNIGVVLHSPTHRFLGARFTSAWKQITDAFPDADRVHLPASRAPSRTGGTPRTEIDSRSTSRFRTS
jgi:hypothetical protein